MTFDKLQLSAGSEACSFIAQRYEQELEDRFHLFPGAMDTLEKVRRLGIRTALLTNGASDRQRAKIERFGLEPWFDLILIEGELGFGKPDERVYHLALEGLSVEPADTWMVGDNLVWDVETPMRLGITGIWNDYRQRGLPAGSPSPDAIIHAVQALPLPEPSARGDSEGGPGVSIPFSVYP